MNIILVWPDMVRESSSGHMHTSVHVPHNSAEGKHITKVLRSKVGDTLSVGVVQGARGSARVVQLEGEAIVLEAEFTQPQDVPNPVILGVGYSRPISMKRILREATMLGAKEIWLYMTDLGESSYQHASIWKDEKYQGFLLDGASQAGGTYIPLVRFLQGVHEVPRMLQEIAPDYTPLVCDVTSQAKPLVQLLHSQGTLICIGSERGWSQKERLFFESAGFQVATLGGRILRTETACAVSLGIVEGCKS